MSQSPQIQGRKKGGGGHVATEASDTLRSIQVAEILDLVSEGPIQGLVNGLKSVYLDGVALQNADGSSNFENVSFAWTAGTQGQAALDGFDMVQNEVAVGVKVTHAVPIERVILAGSNAVRMTIGVPQLSFQDPSNGDMVGNKVEFAIELDSNGGGFVEVYRTTLDGKTMSHYQRAVTLDLTGAAPWTLRVRRITADSTTSNSVNALYWDSYTEIQKAKLRYPNSAVYGLRVNSQNFSRVPTRGYDILGRVVQVPSNYNPLTRAYTGIWDGTFVPAWTNNPAWVFYDLLTHPRYGLGQYVQAAAINKWRLYQIGQYCDELVPDGRSGQEPRFTCNLYLQTQAEAFKVLQDLVAIFRGILLYGNGVVDVVQDAPSDALSLFTPANVIDGKFVYQGASERTRHSGVIVYWNNLANQGKREPELYQEPELVARYGVRNLELSPLGTWSRGQAVRLAKWALYSEDAESEVVNFGVGSEGALVPLGRVFKIADPAVSGERLGGRIRAATASLVSLDKPVTLIQGEAYTLTVAMADPDDPFNLIHETRTVTSAQAGGMALTLATPFSTAPAAQSIWLLESTAVVATTWRCIGVREVPGENRFEITGVAHSPDKYLRIEQGIYLEPKPISRLKPGAVKPTNLVITESVYTVSGAAKSRLTVSWLPGAPGQFYRVSWRYRGGVWQVLPDTSAQNIELGDVMPGTLDVAVRALDGTGAVSPPLEGSYNVGGKDTTGSVQALTLNVTSTGIQAVWQAPTGVDGSTWVETELRRGESFDAGTSLFKGRALSFNLGWLHWGNLQVWAVHRDSSGNVSAPVSATLMINPPAQPVLTGVADMSVVKLAWTDAKTTQPISHYLVKKGTDWAAGTDLGKIDGLSIMLLDLTPGLYTFWVRAVDAGGNEGAPGSVDVHVASPISATLAILNAGLSDAVSDINDLGTSIGTITAQVDSPDLGLQALSAQRSMLALALQSTREAYAALDLSGLLNGARTDKVMRDAGIVVDPATGQVHITGVDANADAITQVQADFDAVAGTVSLQAQRITQLQTDLINAQLDPTGAAVVSGVITQINQVQAELDAANAQIALRATTAVVGDHYLELQQAVQTISAHGQELLVVAQQVNALQNDVAAASDKIEVLEHVATQSTELIAARLADQSKAEQQDATTLAALLQGAADKADAASQLAYAKTQLQASVEELGVSTAGQLTLLMARVGQTETDFVNEVNARSTADSAEVTARQTLAAKQQTDHDNLSAALVTESQARTTADSTEVSARQTLATKQQTDHDVLSAGLANEATARTSADSAEVTARQTLAAKQQNDHNTVSAAVTTESQSRVAADQANAQQITTVQASINGQIAAISQRLAVVVDANGQVVAAYTVALNANGRIVGMRLDNNGTVGRFVVQSDKFAFVLPGANSEIPLFVAGLVNGVNTFGINGQLMVDGSIYARSLAVDKLSAITAKLGTLTSGNLSINSDGGTDWGYARSTTKWWADGQDGWCFARHPGGNVFGEIKGGSNRIWLSNWGDCGITFPGISMTNGGLTISQANVIDTLQINGNAINVPMDGVASPALACGAGSLNLGVLSSGWQYMTPPARVFVTVMLQGIAIGSATNCRVRVRLTASYGGTMTIFDANCTMRAGDAQTPVFAGSVAVPHYEAWRIDVDVGNDYSSGAWTCNRVALIAFGTKKTG